MDTERQVARKKFFVFFLGAIWTGGGGRLPKRRVSGSMLSLIYGRAFPHTRAQKARGVMQDGGHRDAGA
jgi:hypothetical protein